MSAAIDVRGLGKQFVGRATLGALLRGRFRGRPVDVLRGIDLRVERGECVALLGPNGAGKTTLLKCLAGIVTATAGTATVAGEDAVRGGARLRRRVVYVAGDARSFSWRISGRANLRFFAALYGVKRDQREALLDRVLDLVGLAQADRDRPVAEYSTGMQKRLALARGFLADADVLLLDEPTAGLDIAGSREILDYIATHFVGTTTVVVATHIPEHARAVASRAIVLQAGAVSHDGDLDGALARMTS
jgi:ABC-2 type transport system ATP-binding protein